MYRTVVTIYTTSLTSNNSTFCPHTVFMCFVWISEQTAIISLYNINWLVFITRRSVFTARYGLCFWLKEIASSSLSVSLSLSPLKVSLCLSLSWCLSASADTHCPVGRLYCLQYSVPHGYQTEVQLQKPLLYSVTSCCTAERAATFRSLIQFYVYLYRLVPQFPIFCMPIALLSPLKWSY